MAVGTGGRYVATSTVSVRSILFQFRKAVTGPTDRIRPARCSAAFLGCLSLSLSLRLPLSAARSFILSDRSARISLYEQLLSISLGSRRRSLEIAPPTKLLTSSVAVAGFPGHWQGRGPAPHSCPPTPCRVPVRSPYRAPPGLISLAKRFF